MLNKLTKPVTPPEDPGKPSGQPTVLRKTETAADPQNNPAAELPPASEPSAPGSAVTVEMREVCQWLLQFLEEDVVRALKDNPNLQIPYTAPDISPEDWLINALKTILPLESIETVGRHIQTKVIGPREQLNQQIQQLQQEKRALEEELERQKARVEQARASQEAAEIARFRLEKSRLVTMDLKPFIEGVFWAAEDHEILQLLREAVESPTQDIAAFVTRFAPAWIRLKTAVRPRPDEEALPHLQRVRENLSELLRDLSGLYILQRRSLLDIAARFTSEFFAEYDFVSPEESMQVDPTIHNAQGLGSSLILEGLSFAVIRKTTRQTVYYADVKVQS